MKRLVIILSGALALTFILLWTTGRREAESLSVVTHYDLHSDRLACKPRPSRLIFIADLHIGEAMGERLKRTVALINSLHPDIVVMGGDYLSGRQLPDDGALARRFAPLSHIRATNGVVAVLGNNDWEDGEHEISQAMEKTGVVVLHNDAQITGDFAVFGVEEITSNTANPLLVMERYETRLKRARRNAPAVRFWVAHNPVMFDRIPYPGDFMLTGHTHGGQIFPAISIPVMNIVTRWLPDQRRIGWSSGRYVYGTYHRAPDSPGPPLMIVSSGIGTSELPIRLGVRPEIVTVDISGCSP